MRITKSGFGRRGAVALLDNEEENKLPAEGGETGDNANSLETDLVEVTDSAAEGDEAEATQDEAVETKEALEDFAAALESYMGSGGLDQGGARILAASMAYFNKRQGVREADKINIAIESFGGTSTKLRSNQHALEGIKEQLAKLWESIKAGIKRAIEWLKEHYNKMFGAAEKLVKRAADISAKAKDLTGTPTEAKFENERLVKSLNISGNVPASLSGALATVNKAAGDVFTRHAELGATAGQAILDAMSAEGKVDDIKLPAVSAPTMKALSESDAKAAGFEAAPAGMGLFRSVSELPGGKAILARYPTSQPTGKEAVDALTKVTAALGAFNNKASDVTKAELPTLTGDEIGKVATEVETMAKAVIAFRAKADKANEMKAKILAAAEKLSKAEVKEDDKEKKEWMGAMQKLASASVNVVDKPAPQMVQYVLVTGKAALDYCEESAKQYKKG